MKCVILGDVHIGSRNDSLVFAEYHISFFEATLFPYMSANGITKIIQLGDIFDRRKFINFQILDLWKRRVFDYMKSNNIQMDVIVGNHDVYYKNVNDVNSPILLLSEYDNIVSFTTPTEVTIDNTNVLYVPWINSSNEAEVAGAVKKTKSSIAMGHFEFAGFEMDKGHKVDHGTDTKMYKKFDSVYSGHYHHKSDDGHVFYLGVPYQITWIDHGSTKGFHVWDSDSLEKEFVENPDTIFVKLHYDDESDQENHWKGFDLSTITNKYVKLVVVSKKNIYGFDQLLDKISSKNPAELKIIENMQDFESETESEDLNLEDTQDLLVQFVDSIDTDLDRTKLKSFIKTLYTEALNADSL